MTSDHPGALAGTELNRSAGAVVTDLNRELLSTFVELLDDVLLTQHQVLGLELRCDLVHGRTAVTAAGNREVLGLADGDLAVVTGDTGTVEVPVTVTDDLMAGVVALPHGWGHQQASGLSVARRTNGVNANALAAGGPDSVEPISGMVRLTALIVDVAAADGGTNSERAVGNRTGEAQT